MSKQFSVNGWRVELDWQGMTLTPPEQVDRYKEVKLESWMQAADAFVPGGLLLAEVSVRSRRDGETVRRRARRRRIS